MLEHFTGLPEQANTIRSGRDAPARGGFVFGLRQRTASLHAQAEQSGFIGDMLRGKTTRYGFALLLRTLLPAYQALEAGLEQHRNSALLAPLARREVYRAAAIRADLALLVGAAWPKVLPLLSSGQSYADRVAAAATGDGTGLLAHAYTRFLGDLSGGRIISARIATDLGRVSSALRFYKFPEIADVAAFKSTYLAALDAAGSLVGDPQSVIEEAMAAFLCNIAVSEDVQANSAFVSGTRRV